MRYFCIVCLLFICLTGLSSAANPYIEFDRTGSTYASAKLGYTIPVGALADANYQLIASSWRREGITLTGEAGYYITNSTVGGLELSYSNFHPKNVNEINGVRVIDKSRVRIRRVGIYLQYFMVANGKYRPFMKLGAGLFEASRISMPKVESGNVEYRDYSLGAKPVMSIGMGIHASFRSNLSLNFSVEAVSLNSFSSAWETEGATVGPLHKNMLFFPVYLGVVYHLSEE